MRANPLTRPHGLRITDMHRDEYGTLRAKVHWHDEHVDVELHGTTWLTGMPGREVVPPVAKALHDKARRL